MKNLILAFGLILLLQACKSKDPDPEPGQAPPVKENFPACRLITEDFEASYGSTHKMNFYYDSDNKLKRTVYYHNGNYNSTKLFTYHQGHVRYMLTYDSLTAVTDTIVSYEFENGLLKRDVHYNTNNNSILSESSYEYSNGHLRKVTGDAGEGLVVIEVKTDAKGNPIENTIVSINGQAPPIPIKIIMEYDDKLNPFYHLPDFIEPRYFTQNNLIKSTTFYGNSPSDSQEYLFDYLPNNLISKETDHFSQGTHTLFYTYECD